MHFPLRLRADLFRYRLLRALLPPAGGPIFRFSPLVTHFPRPPRTGESATDREWHSPEECVRLAGGVASPVIWLAGSEPLLHPEIGDVARALVQSGRHVFLHTSGVDLRKRIHEFRPDSRLFFAVEFPGCEAVHDPIAGCAGAFSLAMESIRAAKLSGFLVCAHVTVDAQTDVCGADELFETLDEKDVDGFVVSSGGAGRSTALARKLEEIRGIIRHGGWEHFSVLLESTFAKPAAAPAHRKLPGTPTGALEEAD